jgi:hypothetical protein
MYAMATPARIRILKEAVGNVFEKRVSRWSTPVLLYRCPEMARDKGMFGYAAKAHAWTAADNELLLRSCMNAWEFARLFRDDKLYRPCCIRVTFEQGKPIRHRRQPKLPGCLTSRYRRVTVSGVVAFLPIVHAA